MLTVWKRLMRLQTLRKNRKAHHQISDKTQTRAILDQIKWICAVKNWETLLSWLHGYELRNATPDISKKRVISLLLKHLPISDLVILLLEFTCYIENSRSCNDCFRCDFHHKKKVKRENQRLYGCEQKIKKPFYKHKMDLQHKTNTRMNGHN